MKKPSLAVLLPLVVAGLVTVLLVNWNTLASNAIEAMGAQSRKTTATLFRWGELVSMTNALKQEYGSEPQLTYDAGSGDRLLTIAFSDYQPRRETSVKSQALAIATFAIGKTKKRDEVDRVRIQFLRTAAERDSEMAPEAFDFPVEELPRSRTDD